MLDKTDDIAVAADRWLAQFEDALAKPDDGSLKALFHPDSYWRDVLALSWTLQTVNGRDAILTTLKPQAADAAPSGFAIDPDRAAPREVTRAGTHSIEAIFKFETAVGRGDGILRLIPDAADGDRLKAWTLLTALQELKGFEEQLGVARPRGQRLFARFSRAELARSAQGVGRLCRPRSDRAGDRRRPVRPLHRRAAEAIAGRHPDRRSREADRRQLAQALPRADAAQPGAGQSPALHAVSAELADLHPEGQARQLVRILCRRHGAELLDRHGIRGRQLRRDRKAAGP